MSCSFTAPHARITVKAAEFQQTIEEILRALREGEPIDSVLHSKKLPPDLEEGLRLAVALLSHSSHIRRIALIAAIDLAKESFVPDLLAAYSNLAVNQKFIGKLRIIATCALAAEAMLNGNTKIDLSELSFQTRELMLAIKSYLLSADELI